jgi:hypothetical protein
MSSTPKRLEADRSISGRASSIVGAVTIDELEVKLLARGVGLIIHAVPSAPTTLGAAAEEYPWIVWLNADDDRALGVFVGEGDTLQLAIADAIRAWDNP